MLSQLSYNPIRAKGLHGAAGRAARATTVWCRGMDALSFLWIPDQVGDDAGAVAWIAGEISGAN